MLLVVLLVDLLGLLLVVRTLAGLFCGASQAPQEGGREALTSIVSRPQARGNIYRFGTMGVLVEEEEEVVICSL